MDMSSPRTFGEGGGARAPSSARGDSPSPLSTNARGIARPSPASLADRSPGSGPSDEHRDELASSAPRRSRHGLRKSEETFIGRS